MSYDVYYRGEVTIHPPLTPEHAAQVLALAGGEQDELTEAIFAKIAASEESDRPYHFGLFELSEDRSTILLEEGESSHHLRLCLRLLQHYLTPLGYSLNGEIWWEADDRGCLFLKDSARSRTFTPRS